MTDRKEALIYLLEKVEAGGEDTPDFRDLVSRPLMQCRAGEAYRGSLDAAKALHDAVLGSMNWQAGFVDAVPCAMVYPKLHDPDGKFYSESNTTPARALLISILKALIAKEDG